MGDKVKMHSGLVGGMRPAASLHSSHQVGTNGENAAGQGEMWAGDQQPGLQSLPECEEN